MSLYIGDVRDGLRAFAAAGVRAQTCVTSPPYWGLRDYGTARWDGGNAWCDHVEGMARHDTERETPGGRGGSFRGGAMQYRRECGKCGANRIDRQIGLEPTLAEFVETMVDVFRLVRDVLADDGTLWLNLGDSYASTTKGSGGPDSSSTLCGTAAEHKGQRMMPRRMELGALKQKDLCGIPWRVAFALQADGWYLRSEIIWAKKNPMPESVTDRPTKSHEQLFLLAKSERYYYDAAAIYESAASSLPVVLKAGGGRGSAVLKGNDSGPDPYGSIGYSGVDGLSRNRRTVWTIATEPYADAHFATFPTALVEPCILAGSRPNDVVLDPFMGSGTVAKVAQSLGRQWIGCELNPSYAAMVSQRAAQYGMAFA